MEIFSYPENAKELYEKHKKAIEQACEPIATMLALNNPELTDPSKRSFRTLRKDNLQCMR